MQYGYFDSSAREYVITNPATPAPWVNYLGDPEYGAIISNNAAGYSFVKSGANGRVLRYRFNSDMALPGRYIYIRDRENGDYWSASWQPVGKPLDLYRSECRHGTGYTRIAAEYDRIRSCVCYYVPLHRTYEVWHMKISNEDTVSRRLSLFGFAEFTNEANYEQDQVNLQYSLFISRTERKNNLILQTICANSAPDTVTRFLGLAGAPVASACGSLADFIGSYRTYANPQAVERGTCADQMNYNANSCGALQTDLVLNAGETRELTFVLGQYGEHEADAILRQYEEPGRADADIRELKRYWHGQLDHFHVETPCPEFNEMVNVWNAYQCFITFVWSRAASLVYCGLRNGYGYRDTVQDIQGIIHLDPELAAQRIRFMLSAQVSNGAGLPLVKFHHQAGRENTPDDPEYVRETGHPSYRADDALWLFPTIVKYIGETGNTEFLKEVILYADGGEDTVYDHLKRAVRFSMEHMGGHGMPAGLHADWNDCLRLGSRGESTFVAFQLYYALGAMIRLAEIMKDADYIARARDIRADLALALAKCWDEDRFIRGICADGRIVGARQDPEASMWLNPQSFSVISGFASEGQAEQAMESVWRILNTPYGAKLLEPPYHDHYFDGALMHIYNADTKENGAVFSQSQGWLILAEALLGHGDRAFAYFKETSPAFMNEKAEIRQMEPYVHGQFTESRRSPYEGRAHVHWLTGTASTVMVGCVEGICGIRPDAAGLRIAPAIPSAWDGLKILKRFRGKQLSITVDNTAHVQSGVQKLFVNGRQMEDGYIPASVLEEQNEIIVIMG